MIASVKKTTSEKYFMRFENSKCTWASIVIDEQGSFNVLSDNGNFGYSWPKHGRESFKHFLIEISRDPHYLLKKISDETYFDVEATEILWKKRVLQYRENGDLTKKEAREMWDELMEILNSGNGIEYTQVRAYDGPLAKISEPWYDFDIVNDYPFGARNFVEVIMPQFAEILKEEINQSNTTQEEL